MSNAVSNTKTEVDLWIPIQYSILGFVFPRRHLSFDDQVILESRRFHGECISNFKKVVLIQTANRRITFYVIELF
jgi:hypothetical protein